MLVAKAARLVPGTAHAGVEVAPELVLVRLPGRVGAFEHSSRDVAAAQPEGEGCAERDPADQTGVRDRDDRRGDLELVQDHERGDRHDEERRNGRDDLAQARVAHQARGQLGHTGGDGAGDHEDREGGEDVRQVRVDRRDEVLERLDPEHRDRQRDGAEEHDPVRDRPEQPRGAVRHLLHPAAPLALREHAIRTGPCQDPVDEAADELGHEVADDEDDERADEIRHPVADLVRALLNAVADVREHEHVEPPRVERLSAWKPEGYAWLRAQTSRNPSSVRNGSTLAIVRACGAIRSASPPVAIAGAPGASSSPRIAVTMPSTWPAKP